MKPKIFITAFISFLFIFFEITYSQTCTQCDNSGNPTGTYASEIGQNTTASGPYSFAGGINSSANGGVSFAFGSNAIANYDGSFSLGTMTTSDNNQAFAIGSFCKASGTKSFVLGNGINLSTLLSNPIANSMMIGINSDRSTLFVGNSGGIGLTGKVGIGNVTDPQAKLHIKADDGYTTDVLLEWSNNNMANLWLGTTSYGLKASTNKLEFKIPTGGKYVFNDGNLGIGTAVPTQKLEVSGNVKITSGYAMTSQVQAIDGKGLSLTGTGGTGIIVANDGKVGIGTGAAPSEKLDVNGKVKSTSLQITTGFANGKLLQSDASGNAIWTDPAWMISGGNVVRMNGNVGIGTSTPAQKLDVIGTIRSTSLFTNTGTLIVGKDNYTGTDLTEITDPQFEVRSLTEHNRKSANFVDSEGRRIFFVPKIYNGYNPIASVNDAGIFWSDSQAQGSNQNEYSGFVIGPHRDGDPKGIKIDMNGNVGIGSSTPDSKLTVAGKIHAKEIKVSIDAGSDFVFYEDFNLSSLSELENYVKTNKHLPDIPSANEMVENGVELGDMYIKLLQKIEEMTLYIIEQDKQIKSLMIKSGEYNKFKL